MSRFILDSGIASDYINRRHGVRERAQQEVAKGNRIGIGVTVLAELLFGIELSATRDKNLQKLHRALSSLALWPFTEDAATRYGRIAADLRRAGRIIQIFDMMVAAMAFSLGDCTVVSSDCDLLVIPGLRLENWAKVESK